MSHASHVLSCTYQKHLNLRSISPRYADATPDYESAFSPDVAPPPPTESGPKPPLRIARIRNRERLADLSPQ